MEKQENIKIVIDGREYNNLEDVPEEFSGLVQSGIKAAGTNPKHRLNINTAINTTHKVFPGSAPGVLEKSAESKTVVYLRGGADAEQAGLFTWAIWISVAIVFFTLLVLAIKK